MHNLLRLFCILHCAFFIAGCSLPSLESPECTEARTAVKQFYSFHFGNDMRPSLENLELRERFVTPELYARLSESVNEIDPFTGSIQSPTTFKVGECETLRPGSAIFQIQVYWRSDAATVQEELGIEVVKRGTDWLINEVFELKHDVLRKTS